MNLFILRGEPGRRKNNAYRIVMPSSRVQKQINSAESRFNGSIRWLFEYKLTMILGIHQTKWSITDNGIIYTS